MPAPLKATFFAFNRRGQAGVLMTAALIHGLLGLATIASFVLANYQLFASSFYGTPLATDDGASEFFIRVLVSGVALALIYILVTASYEAACLRWMQRGEAGRFGGFSLGGDTWRVFGGNLIWFVVAAVALIGMATLSGVLTSFLVYLGAPSNFYPIIAGFGPLLLWLLILTPLGVRMGTGNAASVARGRFSYLLSWRISEKRAFALLGSYLVLWFILLALLVPLFWGVREWVFETQRDARYGAANVVGATGRVIMSSASAAIFFLGNMLLVLWLAGVNARAVQAAVEDGKIEGVSANVAQVFD